MALILIIDDSSYMRGKLKSILKEDGYEILEADDGLKGLQMVSTHSFDCILLDIIMPKMDGLKILKAINDQGTKSPLIVVTADIQESTCKQCMELGAFAVINKPPKENELRDKVKEAIRFKKGVTQ